MYSRILAFLIVGLVVITGISAQEQMHPVITAHNVTELTLMQRIDFAEVSNDADSEDVIFESGWFVMDQAASRLAVVTASQDILVLNDTGEKLLTIAAPVNSDGLKLRMADAGFAPTETGWPFIATYSDGQQVVIVMANESGAKSTIRTALAEMPVSQWISCSGTAEETCELWLEVIELTADSSSVLLISLPDSANNEIPDSAVDEMARFVYAPDTVDASFVRIGRIEPPFVVTSTPEGDVDLWDLQQQERLFHRQVDTGPVVFGQLNETASHLAWRGPTSETLYLLDFTTNENLPVAELNGMYAQFFLVGHEADVVFAIHVDDEPKIIAWNVATGDRYKVGEYGPCEREPDMARLSADGATLVIGCESGLEIWRVRAS